MSQILITGSNRGIGREMTQSYADRGDTVFAGARKGAPEGANIVPVTLDVTDEMSLQSLTQTLETTSLDLLVCNAGALIGRGGIEDEIYTHENFAQVLAVNVTGVFMTVRAALPAIRRGSGKIAIISSQMGSTERAGGNAYLYRASKAAATNLAVSLSKELGEEGIPVGAYHPGWVRTDMGGEAAAISVEESAEGLLQRFDLLSMGNTGCFEFYSGEPIPF